MTDLEEKTENAHWCLIGWLAKEVMGHKIVNVVIIRESRVVALKACILVEVVGNVERAVRKAAVFEVDELHIWLLYWRLVILHAEQNMRLWHILPVKADLSMGGAYSSDEYGGWISINIILGSLARRLLTSGVRGFFIPPTIWVVFGDQEGTSMHLHRGLQRALHVDC